MKSPISSFCTLDIETTGLDHEKHAILEIACCSFDSNLKDTEEFESGVMRIYDNREITQGALIANGITRDQIANGLDSKEVVEKLCQYFDRQKDGRNKPVLLGHNIDNFDIPFLLNFFEFHKKDLLKYVNTDFTIDSMWWSRVRWTEQTNFKLGTCCESAKVELINAHRAINDTRANKELVKYFIRNLRSDLSLDQQQSSYRKTFEF